MTNISLGILHALHEHKEIRGTQRLAEMLNTDTRHVVTNGIMLHRQGLIEMVFDVNFRKGGRKHATIYRDRGVMDVKR